MNTNTTDTRRVVEIAGVKVDVDLSTAKRIDTFRIGDHVKVMHRAYDTASWEVHHGAIVAFDEFPSLPTVTVCYLDGSGDLKMAHLNAQSKNVEIASANDDPLIDKADVLRRLDKKIKETAFALDTLERQREYFLTHFGHLFKPAQETKEDA